MIDSLYIITTQSEIFYERHWIPDSNIYPLDSLLRCVLRETKPLPVFKAGACVVFSLFEEDIGFISVVSKEISPFYVLELLNQIKEVLASYFECMTSTRLKDKITFVYIIIDEMFANGIPILNWPSLLHQIIKPPTYLDKLASTLSTTKKIEMNNAALYEPIVWRDHSAIVNNCEVLIDVIETLNLTIDKNGSKINTEIYGTIIATVKYCGAPNMMIGFSESTPVFNCVSFHPCVNAPRFNADRVLDFVPPDGKINLLTYTCNASDIYLPFDLDHNLSSKDGSDLVLTIGPSYRVQHKIEDVVIKIHFPADIDDCAVFGCQNEKYSFSDFCKILTWNIGLIKPDEDKRSLNCKLKIDSDCFSMSTIILEVFFQISNHSLSKTKVNKLEITPNYPKDFKGIKYSSTSGRIEIRI